MKFRLNMLCAGWLASLGSGMVAAETPTVFRAPVPAVSFAPFDDSCRSGAGAALSQGLADALRARAARVFEAPARIAVAAALRCGSGPAGADEIELTVIETFTGDRLLTRRAPADAAAALFDDPDVRAALMR